MSLIGRRQKGGNHMPESIMKIINEYTEKIKSCVKDSLSEVIVYGSFARGDYDEHSDIDIMILVNSDDSSMKLFQDELCDEAFELEMQYGRVVSPIIIGKDFFDYWSDTLPFYKNVRNEGVKVA